MTICDSHDCCISSIGGIVVRSLQTMSSVRYFRPFWRKPGRATLTTLCMNFTATYLRTWNETLMQYVSLCKIGLSRASVLHVVFFTVKFYLFVYEYCVLFLASSPEPAKPCWTHQPFLAMQLGFLVCTSLFSTFMIRIVKLVCKICVAMP